MGGVVSSRACDYRPMSVALCIKEGEESEFARLVEESQLSKRLSLVPYHLPTNASYPINLLRNMAIDDSKTNHFWLTDLDMWPSGRVCSSFSRRRALRSHSHAAARELARPEAGDHHSRVRDSQPEMQVLRGMHQRVSLLVFSPLAFSACSRETSRRCVAAPRSASALGSVRSTVSTTTSLCGGTRSPTRIC